jgi:hypothetical protein
MSQVYFHTSNEQIKDLNEYAVRSLELDNDAKKRSKDEAISIHIITEMIMRHSETHAKPSYILYESQISGFYGKPDFIINFDDTSYFMISTTRAIIKYREFTQDVADKLLKKKLMGLSICAENLECLVEDVIDIGYKVHPVLHILTPTKYNAQLCRIAYKNLINSVIDDGHHILAKKLEKIKIVITRIVHHDDLL